VLSGALDPEAQQGKAASSLKPKPAGGKGIFSAMLEWKKRKTVRCNAHAVWLWQDEKCLFFFLDSFTHFFLKKLVIMEISNNTQKQGDYNEPFHPQFQQLSATCHSWFFCLPRQSFLAFDNIFSVPLGIKPRNLHVVGRRSTTKQHHPS
jgi:hypothetical protein